MRAAGPLAVFGMGVTAAGWAAMIGADASTMLNRAIAATGLSRRHVERKCNALYGEPPKLIARKYRALRAAVAMAAAREDPHDAIDRGFYDQSHMIREVKRFVGLTPGQIRAEPTILSQLTISQRSALGGVVSPLVSET